MADTDPPRALIRVDTPPGAEPEPAHRPYADSHSAHAGHEPRVDDVPYRSSPRSRATSAFESSEAGPTPSRKINTLAVVSFVTALMGWTLLPVLGTLVSIITGHLARSEIRLKGEEGDTFAIVGLVLSWVQVALLAGTLLLAVLVFGGLAALLAWLGVASSGVGMV